MGSRLGDRLKSDALINQYQLEYAEPWPDGKIAAEIRRLEREAKKKRK